MGAGLARKLRSGMPKKKGNRLHQRALGKVQSFSLLPALRQAQAPLIENSVSFPVFSSPLHSSWSGVFISRLDCRDIPPAGSISASCRSASCCSHSDLLHANLQPKTLPWLLPAFRVPSRLLAAAQLAPASHPLPGTLAPSSHKRSR